MQDRLRKTRLLEGLSLVRSSGGQGGVTERVYIDRCRTVPRYVKIHWLDGNKFVYRQTVGKSASLCLI